MSNDEYPRIVEDGIEDEAPTEDESSTNDVRYEISSYGADYPVDSLVKRISQQDIYIPGFQRGFVWTLPQASRFIESLLIGLPVPAIFLSREVETGRLVVIDGQQRLKSLQYFYGGRINSREFRLNGVTGEFEGKTYNTLREDDRRRLDDAILHAIIVRQENPQDDESSVYMLFERLNTTSVDLSPQEIRACVYHGPFIDYLEEANTNESWREIFGNPNPRQKDQELLLRFFALYFASDIYKRPMKLFLSDFMGRNRYLKLHDRKKLDSAFKPTVELLNQTVGPKAFRPQRALNTAVTDALLVGVAKRLEQGELHEHGEFKLATLEVLGDDEFRQLYTDDTTSALKINERIRRVFHAIRDIP